MGVRIFRELRCRIAIMMRPPGILCLCLFLFASQPPSTDSAAYKPPAPRQNPSGAACLSYEPSAVELTGTIVRKTFADALDRPETVWVLNLSRPVCVDVDPRAPDINYPQKDVRAIQLVFLDQKMYVTYKDVVGKKAVAKGTLFAGFTAHHHTDLLLTVGTLTKAG